MMKRKPNILFITADQQRADCFGFQGRAVKTPHLDQMARDGTVFSACITPNVVCQPSRASILTGILPMTHGVHDNGIDLDPKIGENGFAGLLSNAGYHAGLVGKAHFSTFHTFEPTGTPECVRSSSEYGDDWYGPYMGFDHVELTVIGHAWWLPEKPPAGLHYERWYYADGHGDLKNRLLHAGYPGDIAVQTWESQLPPVWHNSTWIADRSIEYVRSHKDEPWCLWVSFPDPHHPFDAPSPWSRMHSPEEVDLPEHRTRDLDRRPWWHRAAVEAPIKGKFSDVRSNYSRIPPQPDDCLRKIIANTYGMISLIDHNVGRIFGSLESLGLSENTIVIYSGDHGDWLGDHGLILKGPMFYEGLLRVPMIVRGPGVPAGHMVGDPVSSLDIPASIMDWAGVEQPVEWHSRSLRPLLDNGMESRDFAYSEWELLAQRVGIQLSLQCVRTKSHKLTYEAMSQDGELYDLVADPFEMDNLWNDPVAAAVQRELLDMIAARPDDRISELATPVGAA